MKYKSVQYQTLCHITDIGKYNKKKTLKTYIQVTLPDKLLSYSICIEQESPVFPDT